MLKEIYNEIKINEKDIKVIAFDIFDTLLYRKVSPMHVHRMWAKKIICEYHLNYSVNTIVELKFKCGRLAKMKNISCGKDREYSYFQMTSILLKELKIQETEECFYEKCLAFELEIEKKVTYVPEQRRILFQEVKETNKKLICISDFYLPVMSVKEILEYHNLFVEYIFVSSEYLLQKRTGRLYEEVVRNIDVNYSEILMMGDNEISDVFNAKSKGMKAALLESREQQQYYNKYEKDIESAQKRFEEYMDSDLIKKRLVPFSHVTFLMYLFIDRLYHQLVEDKCKKVLFMSREGEFFKKLFDCYQNEFVPKDERVSTYYFYVSRRATIVPSIYKIEKETFKEIYKNYSKMSIHQFLKNLGLESEEILIDSLKTKINIDESISGFAESFEYKVLLEDEVFCNMCLKKAEQQRKLFVKYLDDMDIDYQTDGLYVVDVGYSGTSQNNISRIFRDKVRIHGYYMISYAEKETITENNVKKGIMYDILSGNAKGIFTYNSAVIEMLSMASHCGVEEYKLENSEVKPVFHENQQELDVYNRTISKIQKTILDEFVKLGEMIHSAALDENYYYRRFEYQYRRFICNPTIEEMDIYRLIPFVDNFAIYRQYIPDYTNKKFRMFSFKGVWEILKTKGKCVSKQDTHWIAVALYKLEMRCVNFWVFIFADLAIKVFEYMLNRIKSKGKKGEQ